MAAAYVDDVLEAGHVIVGHQLLGDDGRDVGHGRCERRSLLRILAVVVPKAHAEDVTGGGSPCRYDVGEPFKRPPMPGVGHRHRKVKQRRAVGSKPFAGWREPEFANSNLTEEPEAD